MSKARPDLDVSVDKAREIVKWLGELRMVERVMITGSRSPKSRKESRDDSDWDIAVVSNAKNLVLPNLEKTYGFHGHITVMSEAFIRQLVPGSMVGKKLVEIYPTDKYGVLE